MGQGHLQLFSRKGQQFRVGQEFVAHCSCSRSGVLDNNLIELELSETMRAALSLFCKKLLAENTFAFSDLS